MMSMGTAMGLQNYPPLSLLYH